MESLNPEVALYGRQNRCARTDTVFYPIFEIHTKQWFRLVPLTRFGPMLRKKVPAVGTFFLVRATAETKMVMKHKLPNTD